MDIEENIEKLNIKYKDYDLKFIFNKDLNRIVINDNYVISKNLTLKEDLKKSYSISFDWDEKYWYIGEIGLELLSKKLIKVAPTESINNLKVKLAEFVKMIDEEKLKQGVIRILKSHPEFFVAPAAIFFHHNYLGGLLEHSVQTTMVAIAIAECLSTEIPINMDLLIVGSLLHDLGKISCYKLEAGIIKATKILREQDHIINGIKLISQELDYENLDEIIHIIASHHNIKDWGSPVEPVTNEAWIIHFAENLSSKILG